MSFFECNQRRAASQSQVDQRRPNSFRVPQVAPHFDGYLGVQCQLFLSCVDHGVYFQHRGIGRYDTPIVERPRIQLTTEIRISHSWTLLASRVFKSLLCCSWQSSHGLACSWDCPELVVDSVADARQDVTAFSWYIQIFFSLSINVISG